ncbi:MAG: two-component regulator propeller domain-containing protein, partial [bacterium]
GLSQSVINTIIQDKRGFLWFGTQEGLNRYDGYEFKKFYHDPQNPNSMSAKHINYLIEQKDAKVLWIGTEGGGLDRFDLETQEFRHYQHIPDDSTSLSSNFITGLEFSSSGYLWAATNQHGLNRLDLTTGHIKQYHFQKNNEKSISSEGVTTLFNDSQGRLWVGLNTAVLERYDAENEQFIHFSFQDKFDSEFILDIVEINNKLWLATNKSILIYDPEKERIESFTGKTEGLPPDFRVEKLCVESVDYLWAAAVEKGLYLFDLKNKTYHNFAFNPSDPFGISNNIIGDIYKDTIGNIWIGTRGTGIDAIKKRNKNFYIYQHSSINPFSISHNNIWQIYEDPDFPGKI